MAVTFAITNFRRNSVGNKRLNTGTITFTGTTTDDGDTAPTAPQLGLKSIERLTFEPALDSTSNPENVAAVRYIPSTAKIAFFGGAAAGSPQAALTDGATVTNYACTFEALGF